jgi:hypothetical protein
MKKIVRLTENDLARIVRRVINEQAPTPATAAKKPPYIQIYYGDIIIGLTPEEDAGYFLVRVKGSVKMSDGNFRTLKSAVDVSDKIDILIRGFMGPNGLQSNFRGRPTQPEKLIDVLKTKLTEMNNNVQTYLKSKPTQK